MPGSRRRASGTTRGPSRHFIPGTNAIESLNARYRRAVRARGHFPNEQAAMKCLYLVTRSLDPTGNGRARWAMRWKPALNAFAITFEGRIPARTDHGPDQIHRLSQWKAEEVRRARSTLFIASWLLSVLRPAGRSGSSGLA